MKMEGRFKVVEITCEIFSYLKGKINMNMTCIYWGSSTVSERLKGRKQLPAFKNRWKIFELLWGDLGEALAESPTASRKFSELNGDSLVMFRIFQFRSNICLQKRSFKTASHCACYVTGIENARKEFTKKGHLASITGSISSKSN